jgi:oxygen-independent coproporphyrinogen III oxidase
MAHPIPSLYAHFPFCETRCHYCDFYSIASSKAKASDPDRFEKALIQEVKRNASNFAPQMKTLFFGGGTPSMTPPSSMERITRAIQDVTDTSQAEWTMEANPSSIDRDRMREYSRFGINRVSIGVQSLIDDQLKRLGRVHDSAAVPKAIESVFEAGITNVSCDLLCGVPEQTEEQLKKSIDGLLQFPLNHISIYLLTLPKHHPMYKSLPSEDVQLSHLHLIHDALTARGFEHYEVSNFAQPGKRARHNEVYWTGGSYLGLGPSAHSYDASAQKRWKNLSSLHAWSERLNKGEDPIEGIETLDADAKNLERWMLSLRRAEGFPVEWLDSEERKNRANELIRRRVLIEVPGLTATSPHRLRIDPKSWPVMDSVVKFLA